MLKKVVILTEMRLGDKVEIVAKPIAKVVDKVFKTNLQNCGKCGERKQWLNNLTTG